MKVLILLACVAFAVADDVECNGLRRLKVKHQWAQVYGENAKQREAFGRELFDYLFHEEPNSIQKFERVRGDTIHSHEFGAHVARLISGIDMCIALLNDEDILNAQLAHLKSQHDSRDIPAEYYKAFGDALWHSIPKRVPAFDQDAWVACYKVIIDGMTESS